MKKPETPQERSARLWKRDREEASKRFDELMGKLEKQERRLPEFRREQGLNR